jgi:hypothetical protein
MKFKSAARLNFVPLNFSTCSIVKNESSFHLHILIPYYSTVQMIDIDERKGSNKGRRLRMAEGDSMENKGSSLRIVSSQESVKNWCSRLPRRLEAHDFSKSDKTIPPNDHEQ